VALLHIFSLEDESGHENRLCSDKTNDWDTVRIHFL